MTKKRKLRLPRYMSVYPEMMNRMASQTVSRTRKFISKNMPVSMAYEISVIFRMMAILVQISTALALPPC